MVLESQTPQPGDFFLVNIPGMVGRMIEFGQFLNGDGFEPYEHTGIYIGDGHTVEAMPRGAVIGKLSDYHTRPMEWSSGLIHLSDTTRRRIVQNAISLVGTPYSFLDYASIGMLRLGIRPKWLQHYVATTRHMICSQLVDTAWARAQANLFVDNRFPGDVTPGDLFELLHMLQVTHTDWSF